MPILPIVFLAGLAIVGVWSYAASKQAKDGATDGTNQGSSATANPITGKGTGVPIEPKPEKGLTPNKLQPPQPGAKPSITTGPVANPGAKGNAATVVQQVEEQYKDDLKDLPSVGL